MANNDLQLEYGVKFDVKTGGSNATAEIEALSKSWQALLDKQKLVIKMGVDAEKYTSGVSDTNTSNKKVTQNEKVNSTLKEMSEYYKELEMRAKNFYNANQSDKNAALDGMKTRLEQIKKEINDIEYDLIGITDKKKPRADTTLQLNWIEDLKKEAIGIQTAINTLSSLNMGGLPFDVTKTTEELTTTNFELLQMREYYKQIEIEADKLAKTTAANNKKLVKDATSNQNQKDIFNMDEGSIDAVEKKLQKLYDTTTLLYSTAGKVGFDDEKLNGAIRKTNDEFTRLQQKLASLKAGFGNQSLDKLLQINPKSIQEANALMAELAKRREALNRTDTDYGDTISSINKKQAELSQQNAKALELGVQRQQQIHGETDAYIKQSNVISNLKNIAATYLSIYEAGRLIKNIATITGEFELQQKSLAAILKDADKANEIFSQVKTLAVVSPFQFKDLLSYTKQLAAYRIETDTLYQTMKNLADVSSGLGVDMSRIILAYGQVSAASVLRGQELRQFTEAGIPLVALLADKFSELEGRVVSTGEVFGKISDRLVPFKMVKDIFSDMSAEGGMFYNMQEIQAETLAGKISNLTDAYQIMFASIGGSGAINVVLKGSVDLLMQMARSWKDIASVVVPAVMGLAIYKASLLAVNIVQKANMVLSGQAAAISKANAIALEMETAATNKKLAMMQVNQTINAADLAANRAKIIMSMSNVGMIDKEVASIMIRNIMLKATTTEQGKALAIEKISQVLKKQGIAIDEARTISTSLYTEAVTGAGTASVIAGAKIKAAFLSNPFGWIALVITALITLGMWIANAYENAHKLQKELAKIGSEGLTDGDRLAARFESLAKDVLDSTKTITEHNQALQALKQIYGEILPAQYLTVEGLKSLKGNYEELTQAIKDNIDAKTKEKQLEAISNSYGEDITKGTSNIKRDLNDLGVSANTANIAIKELQERLNKGEIKGNPYQEFIKIIKEIDGTDITKSEGMFSNKNLSEVASGVFTVSRAVKGLNKDISDFNKQPTTWFGSMTIKAKENADNISKVISELEQGVIRVKGKKDLVFDESLYQFNERKAKVQIDMMEKFLISNFSVSKTRIEAAVNGDFEFNSADLGIEKFVSNQIKKIKELKPDAFSDQVAKIVQPAIDAILSPDIKTKNLLNQIFVPEGMTPQDYLSGLEADFEQTTKKIKQAKNAINDGQTVNKITGTPWVTELETYEKIYKVQDLIRKANGLSDDEKTKKTAAVVNPRIAALEAEIALVEQAKKKYEELVKAGKSPEQSKTIVNDLYKDQFKLKNEKGEILFKPVFDENGLIGSLKTAKSEFQKISKTEKQVFNVGLKINESEIKIFTDEIKNKLSEIEKEFNTSKKRIDIFKSIFDTTGDSNLAKKIAESIEGAGTVDLASALNKSFKEAFKVMDIDTTPLFDKMGNVDIQAAQKAIDLIPKESDSKKEAQKQLDIIKDFQAKEISELFKGLTDFESYEAKKTKIAREGIEERYKISLLTVSDDVKKQKTDASLKKEAKEISKVNVEQFKESPMWADTFSNLDKMSDKSLMLLKGKLEELIKSEQGVAEPTQLKELMKALEDIEKRTSELDFGKLFKTIFENVDLTPLKTAVDEAQAEVDRLKKLRDEAVAREGFAKSNTAIMLNNVGGDVTNPLYIKTKESETKATENVTIATNNLTVAQGKLTVATTTYTTAADKKKKALKDAEDYLNKEMAALNKIQSAYDSLVKAVYDVADAFGVTFSDDAKEMIDAFSKGFGAVISVLGAVLAVIIAIDAATDVNPILLAIAAGIAVLAGAFALFKYFSLKPVNDELKKQQEIVKNLEKEYADLEKSMQKSLGTDWIDAYNKELVNLKNTTTSLSKQIEIEKSKGKDADQAKIDEMQKSLDDTNQKIVESSYRLQNFISGTDLTSAAKDFATSWLDAYKSFGSTTEAMKGKFKDMLNNMVVNTMLSKVMMLALQPVFDEMEKASKEDGPGGSSYTPEEIAGIIALVGTQTDVMNANSTYLMDMLKKSGIDIRDTNSNLTGLSKGIAGVSEDTALLLGGYLNSIRFRLFAYFDSVEMAKKFDLDGSMSKLMTSQATQISHLEGIKSNTLRSAIASENLSAKIDSVIAVSTAGSGYAIKVNA